MNNPYRIVIESPPPPPPIPCIYADPFPTCEQCRKPLYWLPSAGYPTAGTVAMHWPCRGYALLFDGGLLTCHPVTLFPKFGYDMDLGRDE